jgi:hypothetical protein
MMHRLNVLFSLCAAIAAVPAESATLNSVKFNLRHGAMKAIAEKPQSSALRTIFEGEDWAPVVALPRRDDAPPLAATDATARAVMATGLPMVRVELEIQPLAGHRSFDTMSTRRGTLGWTVVNRGNPLGVGTTGTYGFRLAKAWRFTPFVSIDYNRIDSARYVDSASPRPFMVDNADTGFTGSMGATLSHRFGAERRFRALAFGAMIAATEAASRPQLREFGSAGARLVNALGHSGVEATWSEVGLGLDYRIAPRANLGGSVIQTIDRATGETMGAKLGLRIAL